MFILDKELNMPMIPVRGIVIFPGQLLHFDVVREKSIAALEKAESGKKLVFLVTQKNISDENPKMEDLYGIGTVAVIEQILRIPGKNSILHISVKGLYRAGLNRAIDNGKFLFAELRSFEDIEIPKNRVKYCKALMRKAIDYFCDYLDVSPAMSPDIINKCFGIKNPGDLADCLAENVIVEFEERQKILEIQDPIDRLEQVMFIIVRETNLLKIEEEISEKVQERIDKNQRLYYLNEEMKAITEEMNGTDSDSDIESYRSSIHDLKASDEVKNKLLKECSRLEKMSQSSPDAYVSRNYIETCLELPWGVYTEECKDIDLSAKILEKDHYGLKKVKERILEQLAVSTISSEIKGQIICLVGPPGVGKTSVARSIARATGRNYVRIALGGVKDEAEIRGHRKTYIGSMPGRIIDAIQKSKSSNPLILLDEVDKLSADYRGDPTSALLEVLDPEQNFGFTDHFIDMPFDLSRVLFITTANIRSDIPAPLQDRMEIIELSSYTFDEKFNIAKKHLLPKQIKRHGLKASQLHMTDKTIKTIISDYTKESGVRSLEQNIASICRKAAVKIISGETEKINLKPDDLVSYLGTQKYKEDILFDRDEIGVTKGLAWTSFGGEMLEIETAVLEGNGKLELTGSLGDVMKESAKTAVSFIRSKSETLHLDNDFYKTKDIHIHVPEGATPKDGPSAGVTIATSLVSALIGKKVRSDVAMTGEITLRGRVLPIGGLKEKSMAAYRAGIKTVIIPYENLPDLDEVDDTVKNKIRFKPVKTIDQVWNEAVVEYNGQVGDR
ncbi:MAG: endopeptidase La [Clostridia bacterium]|nr:endopeptidase La [Clostridia bacterium]